MLLQQMLNLDTLSISNGHAIFPFSQNVEGVAAVEKRQTAFAYTVYIVFRLEAS